MQENMPTVWKQWRKHITFLISAGYILWIAIQSRLKTRDRLEKFQLLDNDECVLCKQQQETHEHLLFECNATCECLDEIKQWINWRAQTVSLNKLIRWIGRAKFSKFRKQFMAAVIASLVYNICNARNDKVWNNVNENAGEIVRRTKQAVKTRVAQVWSPKVSTDDINWFSTL